MTTYSTHEGEDILDSGCDGLVNAVNCVGVMGKGLALAYKQRFPAMFESYRQSCTRGEVEPGRVHVYPLRSADPPFFILNFPTKDHWQGNSELQFIQEGLQDLRNICVELKLRTLAVPALGCGLGGLSWSDVGPRIVTALFGIDGLHVMIFPPRS